VTERVDGEGSRIWGWARRELAAYQRVLPIPGISSPDLLGTWVTDDEIALLLSHRGLPVEPHGLSSTGWAGLGLALAHLHQHAVADDPIWRRSDSLAEAIARPDVNVLRLFWQSSLPQWEDIYATGEDIVPSTGQVFIHGDFHLANVLINDDRSTLTICDWQMCGFGRPSADLGFVNARLAPDGVVAPIEFLAAYAQQSSVDRPELAREVIAEELLILFFQWPHFAKFNTATRIQNVRTRVANLAQQLGL
jgi:Ser/Thr protein kinase RdoA (MazF antagonist)